MTRLRSLLEALGKISTSVLIFVDVAVDRIQILVTVGLRFHISLLAAQTLPLESAHIP